MGALIRIGALAIVLGAAAALARTEAAAPALQPSEPLSVRVSVPATVQFGDPFTAHVVVLADRRTVDSRGVRVVDPVAPLTLLEPERVSRYAEGPLDVISVELTTACLEEACVAGREPPLLRLPPVRVEAPGRSGGPVSASGTWPPVVVHGRVSSADLARRRLPFRTDLDPPPVTYRLSPSLVAALLDVLAALLAVAAVLLAGRQVARILRGRGAARGTELERALALAREAQWRSPEDRRRALGLLARVLPARLGRLARSASDLAWSPPDPQPASLSDLADQIAREADAR